MPDSDTRTGLPGEGPTTPATATVLVVTDKPATVADAGLRQAQRYEVCYAFDRHTALEKLDDTVDVILFDRHLPGVSGEDVVTEIHERNLTCRAIMLTDSNPPVESEARGFDATLQLPVSRAELVATVEAMLRRTAYDTKLQEYFSLATRKAALEAEHDQEALADHPGYRALADRCDHLRDDLDALLAELSWRTAFTVAITNTPTHRDVDDR